MTTKLGINPQILRKHPEYREKAERLDDLQQRLVEARAERIEAIQAAAADRRDSRGESAATPTTTPIAPRESAVASAARRVRAGDLTALDETPAPTAVAEPPQLTRLERAEQRVAILERAVNEQQVELNRLAVAASALVCPEIGAYHEALARQAVSAVEAAARAVQEWEAHLDALGAAGVKWSYNLPGARTPEALAAPLTRFLLEEVGQFSEWRTAMQGRKP